MNKELINQRIQEHQKDLDTWNEQMTKILNGEAPNLTPFSDMVSRHVAMYINKIEELKWVLDNANA